jgi:hypothetical protein
MTQKALSLIGKEEKVFSSGSKSFLIGGRSFRIFVRRNFAFLWTGLYTPNSLNKPTLCYVNVDVWWIRNKAYFNQMYRMVSTDLFPRGCLSQLQKLPPSGGSFVQRNWQISALKEGLEGAPVTIRCWLWLTIVRVRITRKIDVRCWRYIAGAGTQGRKTI